MPEELNEGTTYLLPPAAQHENVFTLRYGPNFLDELEGLAQAKQHYDVVLINAVQCGFLFSAEHLIEAGRLSTKLLTVQGTLIFAKADKAVAIVRDSLMGDLSIHIFDSLTELYDYSPSLASHVQLALGNTGFEETTDLAQQVLMSAVPVLTQFGIKLKAGMESSRKRNLTLGAIDNYSPLSAVAQRVGVKGEMPLEELLEEIRSLEQSKAIFPIMPKVPFLVHCFRNQVSFNLKEYLVAARLSSQEQIDEMLLEQQNNGGRAARLSLEAMCVSKGYLTSRQLEIALQDLAFYGQTRENDKVKVASGVGEQSVRSLVGHLGTTDPAGLLQSLATNRENGVLSVEHRDLQFRALYEMGRVTHAKLGRIKGNRALIEFVSIWREGIFVFIQRKPPADLADESCQLTRPLDKLLLDAALAQDNVETVWKKLPRGANTPLEKLPDSEGLFDRERPGGPVEKQTLSPADLQVMQVLWKALDGLTPVFTTIRNMGDLTTFEASAALDRLLLLKLVSVPAMDITGPLDKFRQIAAGVGYRLGTERNVALLRLSLQANQGYSVKARMFTIGTSAEIGLDLVAARSAGGSLTSVLKELEDWQVKYIEYVSQELDRNVLRDIVFKVHQQK